ncbi:MAG TPA: PEGA domain-containing protein, partial [Gemmatimonadales bacterium]|nr:PEGA domain-containing protein [Gemmatimonadales bacterium]
GAADTTTHAAAPAGPATPPVPAATLSPADSGTLRIGQIPRGAVVMVDGRQMRQNPTKLQAGSHDVLVTAPGYDNLRQRVQIAKNAEFALVPEMRRFGAGEPVASTGREIQPIRSSGGSANCASPGPTYNVNGACWDKRPRPSDQTPPAVPVSDPNLQGARGSILYVHVGADGTTLDVQSFRPSNDPVFEQMAKRYAMAMQWTPASKNGTSVGSWVQQMLVPTAP